LLFWWGVCSAGSGWSIFARRQTSRRKDSRSLRYRGIVLDGTLRGKGGSLCQLTLSMIPSLVILFCSICCTVPPTFPTKLSVTGLTSSFRNGKTLFRQPPQASRHQTSQSNTNVQHEKVIEQMLDFVKTSLVEDSRARFKDFAPRAVEF
jgi:hypothetical protein